MSRYNLIDEPWIPVRFLDGKRAELGVQETLLRAKEIAVIEDPSPLVTAALHRFLLAVLYRALMGPTDIEQAKTLFRVGLPEKEIRSYLKKWRDRFFLFDEKYPFGQHPKISSEEIEPWTKLTPEYNARSNKVLFDHTDTKLPGERSLKECAKWIISTMSFSVSGGSGYYTSPNPNVIMCIPIGTNLEETLSFSLIPQKKNVIKEDQAQWERPQRLMRYFQKRPRPKRPANGFADLYTWQPRVILLESEISGNITTIRFVAGEGFENPSGQWDPMVVYRKSDKKGWLPFQFSEKKDFWRSFYSLLPGGENDKAPLVIENAFQLYKTKKPRKHPLTVLVLGLKNEPPSANLDFWRMERFTLPEALRENVYIRSEIQGYLEQAESSQNSLWGACCSFARASLAHGDRKVREEDVQNVVKQIPSIPWFWATLEARFHEILQSYTLVRISDDIEMEWLTAVRNALRDAWEKHRASISLDDAWAIRALVKAEGPIRRKIKELDKLINPKREVA